MQPHPHRHTKRHEGDELHPGIYDKDLWGWLSWAIKGFAHLFAYLVARCCMSPEQEVEYDCIRWRWWWWRGSPRLRAPWNTQHDHEKAGERRAPPRWEHDPITGLCNRSEPRSALCNSIRSAHCSQLEHQCHRDTKQCGSKRNSTHTVGVSEKVAAGVNIHESWVHYIKLVIDIDR